MRRTIPCLAAALCATPAPAAEPQAFGQWTAYCASDAGCALATAAEDGHRLAFSEPAYGEDRMVFLPLEPILRGSTVTVTLDGAAGASLGPGDGWRMVEMPGGAAAQIAPSVAENELMVRMPGRTSLEIAYQGESGTPRKARFDLDGYARARAWVTSNQ